jgi:transaldolase
MKATQLLHNLGQSLWLDNITRDLLNNGRLKSYLDELSVTGLTSNPTIFDQAIKNSTAYDAAILDGLEKARSSENLFFDLALDDLTKAADLFRTIYDRTNGVDGWVSLEVSPLLAHDTAQPSQPPGNCSPGRAGQTSSSRFLEHPKDYRPLRKRFSLVCRST